LKNDSDSAATARFGDITDSSPIGWDYISGFFDGEGSITVETRADSGVLVIFLTFSQKYRPLLEAIAKFLRVNGITCTVYQVKETVHEIRIRRIESICKLLRRLRLTLKRDQATATLAYFDGRISGNQLIEVFDLDFKLGKRRSTPLRPGVDYPLRHTEAVLNAGKIRAFATRSANLIYTREFLLRRIDLLPTTFRTTDVAKIFGCSLNRARYSIRRMEANGLVSCKIVGKRGRGTLSCTKLKVGW
jgi:LAGLIDADG-like domain